LILVSKGLTLLKLHPPSLGAKSVRLKSKGSSPHFYHTAPKIRLNSNDGLHWEYQRNSFQTWLFQFSRSMGACCDWKRIFHWWSTYTQCCMFGHSTTMLRSKRRTQQVKLAPKSKTRPGLKMCQPKSIHFRTYSLLRGGSR